MIDEATYQKVDTHRRKTIPAGPFRVRGSESSTDESESSTDESESSTDESESSTDESESSSVAMSGPRVITQSKHTRSPAHESVSGTCRVASVSETCRFTLSPPAMLIAPWRGGLIRLDQLDSTQKEGNFYQFEAVPAEAKPEDVVLMSCRPEVHGFSLRQKQWSRSSPPLRGSTVRQICIYDIVFAPSRKRGSTVSIRNLFCKRLVEPRSMFMSKPRFLRGESRYLKYNQCKNESRMIANSRAEYFTVTAY